MAGFWRIFVGLWVNFLDGVQVCASSKRRNDSGDVVCSDLVEECFGNYGYLLLLCFYIAIVPFPVDKGPVDVLFLDERHLVVTRVVHQRTSKDNLG